VQVFISYSTKDLELVREIAHTLEHRATVKFWYQDKVPGTEAWTTIHKWIDDSQLVFVVLTDNAISRGISVGQEVGRAKAQGKVIVPLVAPGVPSSELGCLHGVTYIRLADPTSDEFQEQVDEAIEEFRRRQVKAGWTIAAMFAVLGILNWWFPDEH